MNRRKTTRYNTDCCDIIIEDYKSEYFEFPELDLNADLDLDMPDIDLNVDLLDLEPFSDRRAGKNVHHKKAKRLRKVKNP